MDTDSLYLALAHENLYKCIQPEMRSIWNEMRSNGCTDFFHATSTSNFFPRICCDKHIKHDKREPGLFKEEFRCTEMLCLCGKTNCCYNSVTEKLSSAAKDSTRVFRKKTVMFFTDIQTSSGQCGEYNLN